MRIRFTTSTLILCLLSLGAFPTMRDSLEGKWAVVVTPDDDAHSAGEREFKDTLTFHAGNFTSDALDKRGFPATLYEERVSTLGAGGFESLQKNKNADEGTATWTGFMSGSEMRGDLAIKKKDGTTLNFAFKGSRK